VGCPVPGCKLLAGPLQGLFRPKDVVLVRLRGVLQLVRELKPSLLDVAPHSVALEGSDEDVVRAIRSHGNGVGAHRDPRRHTWQFPVVSRLGSDLELGIDRASEAGPSPHRINMVGCPPNSENRGARRAFIEVEIA